MPLKTAELVRLHPLTPVNRLLFLAAEARQQWWTTTSEIIADAGVSQRRGRLGLRKLVRDGWLECEHKGAQNQERLVRFRPGPAMIKMITALGSSRSERCDPQDQSAVIPTIRAKGAAHLTDPARDPDLSLKTGSMDQRVRPSEGVQGGTDGRTDGREGVAEHRNALTQRVCREWRRWAVTESVAYRGIDRVLNARLTERELEKFLVDALKGAHPAFHGVQEHVRWGQSTSDERIKLWLNIERTTRDVGLSRPRRVRDVEPNAFHDAEAQREIAKRKMRGER